MHLAFIAYIKYNWAVLFFRQIYYLFIYASKLFSYIKANVFSDLHKITRIFWNLLRVLLRLFCMLSFDVNGFSFIVTWWQKTWKPISSTLAEGERKKIREWDHILFYRRGTNSKNSFKFPRCLLKMGKWFKGDK